MDIKTAKEYAIALFDVSLEKDNVDIIYNELKIITQIINDNKDVLKLLSHPQLSIENKKDIIKDIFKDINQVLKYFLFVLIENNRMVNISIIFEEFMDLYNSYNKIIPVVAKTTIPLTNKEKEIIEKKLTVKYRQKVKINNVIDSSIIGGLKLIIKNKVYDYSLKTQVNNLKSYLLKHI